MMVIVVAMVVVMVVVRMKAAAPVTAPAMGVVPDRAQVMGSVGVVRGRRSLPDLPPSGGRGGML